jgi:hypothetical protein
MAANPEDGIRFIREIRGSNLFYADGRGWGEDFNANGEK